MDNKWSKNEPKLDIKRHKKDHEWFKNEPNETNNGLILDQNKPKMDPK